MPKFVQLKTILEKLSSKKIKNRAKQATSVLKKKKLRTPTIYAAIALLILAPVIYLTLKRTNEAAAWWDETWQYRVGYNISGSADTNKKIKIDIDTATLISEGKMQSDCGDSRFTNAGGVLLRYYLDSAGGACNTASTDYYVLVDTFYSTGTLLFHYYGHPTVANGTEAANFSESTYTPSGTSDNPEEVSKGPIGYWKLDESQGTSVYDSMNRNDAALGASTAAPQWKPNSECVSGTCLFFDNSNDYAEAADSDTLDIPDDTDFTMSAWVKIPTIADNNMIIAKKQGTSNTHNGYAMYVNNAGKVAVYIADGTDQINKFSDGTVTADVWTHIVSVFDEDTGINIYINGVDAQGTLNGTIADIGSLAGGATLRFGTDSDGDLPFHGYIDEPKIYRYARTADEIKNDYATGSASQGAAVATIAENEGGDLSNGLQGYWKLDESASGECSEVIDSITYIDDSCDASGNQHSGIWSANATAAQGKFGNGVSFDGVDDLISVAYSAALAPTDAISFGGWFETDDKTQDVRIISKTQSGGWNLGLNDTVASSLTGVVNVGGYHYVSYSNTNISNDTWYHAFVTYDGETVRLYLNGEEVDSNTDPSGSITYGASNALCIGGEPDATSCITDNEFDGTLDEIRVYSRALNPAEVRQLYNFAPGPIAHWKLDEATGTSAIDSSGNGNAGTLGASTASPQWSQGKYGGALTFDGSDDYVSVADPGTNSALDFSADQEISISLWINPDTIPSGINYVTPIGKGLTDGSGQDLNYSLSIGNDDQLIFCYANAADAYNCYEADGAVSTGEWQHIALTYTFGTSSTARLYKNGTVISASWTSGTGNDDPNVTDEDLWIGAINISGGDGTEEEFDGHIDDVKIYNYTRTPAQILQDMNAGHPNVGTPVGSTVLNLKLNEGYGTTAYDSSPHTNNGTISSASWTNSGRIGKALDFAAASNNYIEVASDASLNGLRQFTISTWIYADSYGESSGGRIIEKNGASDNGFSMWINGTTWESVLFAAAGWDGTGGQWRAPAEAIQLGQWYHIALSYDYSSLSNDPQFYINGEAVTTTETVTPTGSFATESNNIRIGANYQSPPIREFDGKIDEMKIYPFVLTQDQIYLDFNQGKQFTMGAVSTASDGSTSSNESARSYCVPGDTSTCNGVDAEWKLDEATGTSAFDTSGNSLTASFPGSTANPTWVSSGKFGSALSFDGNDYIAITDHNNIDASSTFSFSMWIKTTATSGRILSKHNENITNGWSNGINGSGQIYFDVTGPSHQVVTSVTSVNDGNWHMVAGTLNGTDQRIYIDGRLDNSRTYSGTPVTNSLPLEFGAVKANSARTDYYVGSLDQVRIYKYVRTPAQIAWDYNQGKPIAHYKFDECQGTTINNWAPNSSGGFIGSNGTLTIGGSGSQTSVGTCTSAGGAWSNSGKVNASIEFDGTDDYVTIPDNNMFTFGNGTTDRPFSISAWVYVDDNAQNVIAAKYDETTGNQKREWLFYMSSGSFLTLEAYDETADGYISRRWATEFPEGEWHHVVGTYDGSESQSGIKIYVDGVRKDDTNSSSGTFNGMQNTAGSVEIGRNTSSAGGTAYPYDGMIDDVKIYNYALTQDQVQTDMAGGAVSFR